MSIDKKTVGVKYCVIALINRLRALENWRGPDGIEQLCALLVRLDAGTGTDSDHAMLTGLPACDMTPHELVRMVEKSQREV